MIIIYNIYIYIHIYIYIYLTYMGLFFLGWANKDLKKNKMRKIRKFVIDLPKIMKKAKKFKKIILIMIEIGP